MRRLQVIGAPGAGKSSLARALAERTGLPLVEADDLFWAPGDPPYQNARSLSERARLIAERLPAEGAWILAGAMPTRDAAPAPGVTHVIRLDLAAPERLARLRGRESARFGGRIGPGGDMQATHAAFLDWAAAFDDEALDRLVRASAAPVLRLDASLPPEALLEAALCGWEAKP